jgi:hypothetical protein
VNDQGDDGPPEAREESQPAIPEIVAQIMAQIEEIIALLERRAAQHD